MVGLVLAGGQSRRLGVDKTQLTFEHRGRALSLVEWAAERLSSVCQEVLIAGGGTSHRDTSAGLSRWKMVEDGDARGPAAGILGAADARAGQPLLVLACDLPRVTVEVLSRIAEQPSADWIVPARKQRLETTCALYRTAALEALAKQAERGEYALQALCDAHDLIVRRLDEQRLGVSCWDEIFFNLNEPEDLKRWRAQNAHHRS